MTDTALANRKDGATSSLIEEVVIQGNLANLLPPQRAAYYAKVCDSLGLNPYSRPFEYITLNQKLVLYARKDATDQLRALRKVSLAIVSREIVNDLYVVTARATLPDGRADEEIGAVPIKGLGGEALANAMMKASTKAKRRVTLSIVGLGWLDESETETIPGARPATVDADVVIHDEAPPPAPARAPAPPLPATNPVRVLLEEALDLAWRARGAGLQPTQPTAAATDAQLKKWMDHWAPLLAAAEARAEEATTAESEVIEPEDIPFDAAPEPAVNGVPGDDVESLSGLELVDACERMRRRLAAGNLPYQAMPNPRTNESLRAWWHAGAALLAASS